MTMKTSSQPATRGRPSIHLIAEECDALTALALRIEQAEPVLADLLLTELERAELHSAETLPPRTIAMNSMIAFVDERSGTPRTVQLVYPHDADIEAGRISILTPIGAGLIGLAQGDSIVWPDRDGQERLLRIVRVDAGDPV
jgi:regulator of nucleoside diphosphate kinase